MTDPSSASGEFDPRYVEARRVLLDALFALAPHGPAIIIAGAQAVYLRTGASDMSVAPYTTDGDLALNPSLLGDDPPLEQAMEQAGFTLMMTQPGGHIEPGIWVAPVEIDGWPYLVPVDLIVPRGVADSGSRRGARLRAHGERAARQIPGLEAVLVDHSPILGTSLDPADDRSIEAEVAGVAALLVAKAHKLHDRLEEGKPHRVGDKDAADVVRIMQTTSPAQVGQTLAGLVGDATAGQPTTDGLRYLDQLFGRRGRPGIEMAVRALRVAMDPNTIEVICTAYIDGIRAAINGPG